jgi:hypothetical protein
MKKFDITKTENFKENFEVVEFNDLNDLEEVICAGIGGTVCGCDDAPITK